MTKKTRTIIFLTFLIIFLSVTPVVCLYSQGYRVDFNPPAGGKILTQTGGIYFKILPKQSDIYLDGKLREKTDFLFGSLLIENLLPKKYKIEVKKAGFYSWEKTLEIKEKEVTEARNIVLFPANPDFKILSRGADNFWFSPDQKKIIMKEPFDTTQGKSASNWALKLYEPLKNVKSHLINAADFSLKDAYLLDLQFSDDSTKVFLEIGAGEQIQYFTLSFDKIPALLLKSAKPTPLLEDVIAYKKAGNDVYYLDNSGNFYKNEEGLTAEPFPVKQETEYTLEVFSGFFFLREEGNLYKFNTESKVFENFFEGLRSLKISPDSQKFVYFSDYEIWIAFLKDSFNQPQRKSGDKIFLMRLSEKIDEIFWLDSYHLAFNTGDKIKICEIDNRDGINVVDIGEFKNPDFFWAKNDKKLYILSEGDLSSSLPLLP